MLYALCWFAIASLFALWSLGLWGLHAVAVWTVTHAGLIGDAASGLGSIALPAWLAPWVPVELTQILPQVATLVAPLVEALLQAAPAVAGLLSVLAWGVWGLGGLLLLLLGLGMHLLIKRWRHPSAAKPASSTAAAWRAHPASHQAPH